MLVTLFFLEEMVILQKVIINIGFPYHKGCNETFSAPGLQNPVFCPVVRFSKNYIFETYSYQGISGCKNFPWQKVSGFRFLPKSPPYSIFVKKIVSGNILAYLMPNFKVPDKTIRFFVGLSGFLKTTFLTPTHIREFLGAKIFPDKKSPVSSFCLNRIHAAFSSWG